MLFRLDYFEIAILLCHLSVNLILGSIRLFRYWDSILLCLYELAIMGIEIDSSDWNGQYKFVFSIEIEFDFDVHIIMDVITN